MGFESKGVGLTGSLLLEVGYMLQAPAPSGCGSFKCDFFRLWLNYDVALSLVVSPLVKYGVAIVVLVLGRVGLIWCGFFSYFGASGYDSVTVFGISVGH